LIISASRRTDIPAFYSRWFINRIRAGYCSVPNPFNSNQVSKVSLLPDDVDVIVFWTRNPRPLFPYLEELDQLGYKYYFQYTILNNPRLIDPKSPPTDVAIRTFRELSQQIGENRMIWRYDPIVFSNQTEVSFHLDSYKKIAADLHGYTQRSIISIMDNYTKARSRLSQLSEQGCKLLNPKDCSQAIQQLIPVLVEIASRFQMEIFSCAEVLDLSTFGVRPGKCVDNDFIQHVFGLDVVKKKDPSQRKECGCVISKDIGMYNSCLFGCQYCYATRSFELAQCNLNEHNPQSPSMVGWYEPNLEGRNSGSTSKNITNQYSLFDENE